MEKYEKFDEKKTAEERLKKLVATGIPFDYVQKKESIDGEWVVETTLYLYYPGYMRKFTGLAAMSKTNHIYGSSALQFASTASYGRAISMSGVIDDFSCSVKEEIEAAKEIQKEARQDVIKEVSEPADEHCPELSESDLAQQVKANREYVKNNPQAPLVPYKEPATPPLVIEENNTTQAMIVDADNDVRGEWVIKPTLEEVVPEETETFESLKKLGTEALKKMAKELNIPFDEYPRRKTAGILTEMILAKREGRIDDHLKQFCIDKGKENDSRGIAWDFDFTQAVIKRHKLDEFFEKPKSVEIVEPEIKESQVKVSGPNLDNSKVEALIKGWGEERDMGKIGKLFNELNKAHNLPAGTVIAEYKKMALSKIWKYSDPSVFFAEAPLEDVKLLLEQLV